MLSIEQPSSTESILYKLILSETLSETRILSQGGRPGPRMGQGSAPPACGGCFLGLKVSQLWTSLSSESSVAELRKYLMAPQVLWLQTPGSMGWEEKCGKFQGREVQGTSRLRNSNVLEQMEPVCVGIFIHGDRVHLKILELSMWNSTGMNTGVVPFVLRRSS